MKKFDMEMDWVVAPDLKSFLLRRFTTVDLVGSPGFQSRVGSMAIVPVDEEEKLSSELALVEWHENQSSPLILQCENEAFHNCDAANFAEGSKNMIDSYSIAPIPETSADKLTTLVGDEAFWHFVDQCHSSSQESLHQE